MLECFDLTVTPFALWRPVLKDIQFSLRPGEIVGLSGRSGSGKSTLLRAINGLMPWFFQGVVDGEIRLDGETLNDLDPGQRAHLIGSCLDRPDAQLFLSTVRQEMDAARNLYGNGDYDCGVEELLGVDALLDRRILELSSGERQRVALAVTLAAKPRPVLLDEPTAHLDEGGVAALTSALADIAAGDGLALVAEQSGWRLDTSVKRWLGIEEGRLCGVLVPDRPVLPSAEHDPGIEIVLEARGITASVRGKTLFDSLDLQLRRGEMVALTGANGIGKSTLARILSGHEKAEAGQLSVPGSRPPALMLSDSSLQLFSSTVEGEVRACGASISEVARVLRRHRLETLAARAPWSLSRGERQRLVHAAVDVLRPPLVIVDEPAQGLDSQDLAAFMELVIRRAVRGRSYLIITHRPEIAESCHRHFALSRGGLRQIR